MTDYEKIEMAQRAVQHFLRIAKSNSVSDQLSFLQVTKVVKRGIAKLKEAQRFLSELKKSYRAPAAVSLGRRGGMQTSTKYGRAHHTKMARLGHATKIERYGEKEFFALVRAGYKPSQMSEKERHAALKWIAAQREERK